MDLLAEGIGQSNAHLRFSTPAVERCGRRAGRHQTARCIETARAGLRVLPEACATTPRCDGGLVLSAPADHVRAQELRNCVQLRRRSYPMALELIEKPGRTYPEFAVRLFDTASTASPGRKRQSSRSPAELFDENSPHGFHGLSYESIGLPTRSDIFRAGRW